MSDDQETEVRQRLWRLLPVPDAVPRPRSTPAVPRDDGPDPGGSAPPLTAIGPAPASGGNPRRLPGPGPFDPGRRGVRALAVVAVLVVLGAGLWAWRSRPRVEPVPGPPPSAAGPLADVTAAQPSSTGGAELVVAVAGRVRRPGLVRLPAGARVADAIEAAGGAQSGVDVALLNPARKVVDGELIAVGITPPPAAAAPGGPGAGGPPGPVPGGKVDLNTATVAQLDTLPGVGPVLAERIIAHRERQGGFRSVGDLRQVEGIGDARYEQLKDLVTV